MNVSAQLELQQKIFKVEGKLRLICQAYQQLKQQIRVKDEEIGRLRSQVLRYRRGESGKGKGGVRQVRNTDILAYESNIIHVPRQTYKIQPTQTNSNILTPIPIKIHEQQIKPSKIPSSPQFPLPSLHLNLNPNPHSPSPQQQHQPRYSTNTEQSTTLTLFEQKSSRINNIATTTQHIQNKKRKNKSIDIESESGSRAFKTEVQANMLRQLWDQRDQEIMKLDHLFQSIQDKIDGVGGM